MRHELQELRADAGENSMKVRLETKDKDMITYAEIPVAEAPDLLVWRQRYFAHHHFDIDLQVYRELEYVVAVLPGQERDP
jgi:hypothetical protein